MQYQGKRILIYFTADMGRCRQRPITWREGMCVLRWGCGRGGLGCVCREVLPLCLNLDSLDLRINLIGGKDIAKSRKSFNHANHGSDNVAD